MPPSAWADNSIPSLGSRTNVLGNTSMRSNTELGSLESGMTSTEAVTCFLIVMVSGLVLAATGEGPTRLPEEQASAIGRQTDSKSDSHAKDRGAFLTASKRIDGACRGLRSASVIGSLGELDAEQLVPLELEVESQQGGGRPSGSDGARAQAKPVGH